MLLHGLNLLHELDLVRQMQLELQQRGTNLFDSYGLSENEYAAHGGAVPLRALMVAYPNRMHVVTVDGTGINTMADLCKGHRQVFPHSTYTLSFQMHEEVGGFTEAHEFGVDPTCQHGAEQRPHLGRGQEIATPTGESVSPKARVCGRVPWIHW